MNRFFTLVTGFFLAIAVSAQAQTADDAFCALAPIDMLAALDGDWSLKQGAGVAVAGCCATVPLPPHPAQTLTLAYDPATATATLTGAAPGETMIMVPTLTTEDATFAIEAVGTAIWEDYQQIGAGCDWYSIPVMLGTNIYSLNGAGATGPDALWATIAGNKFVYCLKGLKGGPKGAYFFPFKKQGNFDAEWYAKDLCSAHKTYFPFPVNTGDMEMSLILKFQSPSSGTGMLVFKGKQNGYEFAANAPVTLSR